MFCKIGMYIMIKIISFCCSIALGFPYFWSITFSCIFQLDPNIHRHNSKHSKKIVEEDSLEMMEEYLRENNGGEKKDGEEMKKMKW